MKKFNTPSQYPEIVEIIWTFCFRALLWQPWAPKAPQGRQLPLLWPALPLKMKNHEWDQIFTTPHELWPWVWSLNRSWIGSMNFCGLSLCAACSDLEGLSQDLVGLHSWWASHLLAVWGANTPITYALSWWNSDSIVLFQEKWKVTFMCSGHLIVLGLYLEQVFLLTFLFFSSPPPISAWFCSSCRLKHIHSHTQPEGKAHCWVNKIV